MNAERRPGQGAHPDSTAIGQLHRTRPLSPRDAIARLPMSELVLLLASADDEAAMWEAESRFRCPHCEPNRKHWNQPGAWVRDNWTWYCCCCTGGTRYELERILLEDRRIVDMLLGDSLGVGA